MSKLARLNGFNLKFLMCCFSRRFLNKIAIVISTHTLIIPVMNYHLNLVMLNFNRMENDIEVWLITSILFVLFKALWLEKGRNTYRIFIKKFSIFFMLEGIQWMALKMATSLKLVIQLFEFTPVDLWQKKTLDMNSIS